MNEESFTEAEKAVLHRMFTITMNEITLSSGSIDIDGTKFTKDDLFSLASKLGISWE